MLASIEAPPECFSEYSSKQRVLLYSGVSSQHSKRIQQYHSISRKVNQVSSLLRIPFWMWLNAKTLILTLKLLSHQA
jgi:hypothetical protein